MSRPDEAPPAWVTQAREGWTWRGTGRPDFATAPGPGQESVWDYPRPPLLVKDAREVVVRLGEIELARTRTAIRVLETSHPPTFYLPRGDVDWSHLVPAGGGSFCEWKGACQYLDVVVGSTTLPRTAWSYQRPFPEAASLAGHVAFYAHQLTCLVAGARAEPQPGGFYGGWVTPELVGPFKGAPGSAGW
jgi:uncharacterized protein (DUF427 family)